MERKLLNRIRVVLAEKDMNNKQLAELLGKDPAVVSKWVTNTNQPNVETLIQIAKVLEVSVDDLLRTEVSVSAMQPFFLSLCLLPLLQHY